MPSENSELNVKLALLGQSGVVAGVGRIVASFTGLSKLLPQLGAALAATFSVGALAHFTKQAINTADEMGKLAQKTGVAVEQLSALAYAGRLADVDQGTLRLALKELSEELVRTGQSSADIREKLLQVADQFAAMPDGVRKTTLAVQLFGRSGQELIPLLNEGREALAAQFEEAEKLGQIISPQLAANADAFNDNLTRMKALFEGIFLKAAERALPLFVALSDAFIDWAVNGGGVEQMVDLLTTALLTFGETAKDIAEIWITLTGLLEGESLAEIGNTLLNFEQRIEEAMNALQSGRSVKPKPQADLTPTNEELKKQLNSARELLDVRIAEQRLQLDRVKADPLMTEAQRHKDIEAILTRINELLRRKSELVSNTAFDKNLEGTGILTPTETRKLFNEDDVARFRVQQEQMALDQDRFTGRFLANIRTMMDEWGNLGRNMADVFTGSLRTAVQSFSDSIWNVIAGTQTWGQVFAQVARQIISSIIQIVLQWIISMTVLKLLKKLFQTEENQQAAQSAAAWAPAAIAASIASYGAAAAAGGLAFTAAMVAGTALTAGLAAGAGSFAEGGFTGTGGKFEPAGIVHRGEFVMPADAVQRVGLPALEAIRLGDITPAAPSVNVGGAKVSVAVVNDREELRRFLESADGQRIIRDTMGRHRHEFGMDV